MLLMREMMLMPLFHAARDADAATPPPHAAVKMRWRVIDAIFAPAYRVTIYARLLRHDDAPDI